MKNSLKMQLKIFYFNYLFHCYRRTGVKILHISDDFKQSEICLPLNWRTRGFFGTLFGGSIYGAVDPVLMVMLNMILGKEFVVWDKAAKVQFLKPGRSTLYAKFEVTDDEITRIKTEVAGVGKAESQHIISMKSKEGVEHAIIEKIMHIKGKKQQNQHT